MDNTVAQLMGSMGKMYTSAQANTGQGLQGAWPPEGTGRRCILQGLEAKADQIKIGKKGADQRSVPGVVVTCKWLFIRDTADPTYRPEMGDKLAFEGRSFNLLSDEVLKSLDEKSRQRFGYDWERFRGHCSVILRKPADSCIDPAADLKAIQDELATAAPLISCKIEYRQPEGSKTVYKTEYCEERLG